MNDAAFWREAVSVRSARIDLDGLIQLLQLSLPPGSEVVIHDLAKLPNSVIFVDGHATDRKVGDPATDMLLAQAAAGTFATQIGYTTTLPDGRELRSSTVIVKDESDEARYALCVNIDLTFWSAAQRFVQEFLLASPSSAPQAVGGKMPATSPESFPQSVEELASILLTKALQQTGVPRELMRKEHKVAAVKQLKEDGFFMLQKSADLAAEALGVSRFTVYNYLNSASEGPEDG
ncbi:transcriptional regulator [Pseudonocardia sp. RS010]|uniref:helix-turn-helix transcriptional regulator n=1 Tax=Pseudonocardia sp. RS010 TaxID=3385979 RepID=UPI0039A233FC